MTVSKEELKYAKDVALPIVDAVYGRYEGGLVNVEGITHLADIRADAARLDLAASSTDAKTRNLVRTTFSANGLFGSIDREDATGTGFVAFRGTKDFREWIDDFLFAAVPFDEVSKSIFVHAGFHKVYQLVRKSLMDQIHLLSGAPRIVVTGHSLGAAVASLCALDLSVNHGICQ